jgi:hypothetical protein
MIRGEARRYYAQDRRATNCSQFSALGGGAACEQPNEGLRVFGVIYTGPERGLVQEALAAWAQARPPGVGPRRTRPLEHQCTRCGVVVGGCLARKWIAGLAPPKKTHTHTNKQRKCHLISNLSAI